MKETKFITDQEIKMCKLFDEKNLSISSVKYSRGHDGDCMNANLKIGSKIVGSVWDDSWGGGFDYQGEKVGGFLEILDSISKAVGPYTFLDTEMTYGHDRMVQILIEHTQNKRDCKKKTVIIISKKTMEENEGSMWGTKSFEYKSPFSEIGMDRIFADLKDEEAEGFKYVEVVNKRYL